MGWDWLSIWSIIKQLLYNGKTCKHVQCIVNLVTACSAVESSFHGNKGYGGATCMFLSIGTFSYS